MGLKVIPLTLEQANYWISVWHRHHFPVVGHRFSIGCHLDSSMVGVCVVGRPVARLSNQNQIAEVTRLATNGTPNACSILYAASARACRAMGYSKIQTFILDSEPGISLRASGWSVEGLTGGGDGWQSRTNRRKDQPTCVKTKWSKQFKPLADVDILPDLYEENQLEMFREAL